MSHRSCSLHLASLTLALLLFCTGTASAQCDGIAPVPSPTLSSASANAGTLLILPAGNGKTLSQMGLTVSVQLLDCDGLPIPHYPWQDVWLGGANTEDRFRSCASSVLGILADANSDLIGQMTISGGVSGGGNALNGTRVYVGGQALETTLPINITSCDINGDLAVNLADVGEFGGDLTSGTHPARSDFNGDGLVNMLDVAELAFHYGTSCP